jgi:glucokinase
VEPVTGRLWAGVDLGGTGTRVVVVDETGEAVAGSTVPTGVFDDHAVERLTELIRGLASGSPLSGVGIGASGPVDLTTGRINNPDTLPQFTGLDVAGALERVLRVPTWIDNDVVVAGLAESRWGQARGSHSLLCVTLGTGIGAVLIRDGSPVRASDGQHPEGGHIPVPGAGHPCYCGLPQCWEQVASRTALDRMRNSATSDDAGLWAEYAERVASGLITLLTLYHPAAVVIGGSVAQDWAELEPSLVESLSRFREFDHGVPLLGSDLGERAGALGASLLPEHGIGWHTHGRNTRSGTSPL